ncbi:MAG TPA: tetratricopeptide repeat protein [Pyrinomonadaceae bacterium]|nr:tetratricopeptide repeat protein [Pyrinomonadaceae bacterium]
MKIFISLLLAALCVSQTSVVRAKPYPNPPQARDNWRSVRTNNLFVIGNADAEKLRQVAAWLEFFHTSFARLVSRNVLNSSVPTTVIIFRDDASFLPFKPLYQGRPANIAGFFQPGEDVNYIAISLDPGERDPYSTAFHEYVHLHLRDNVPNTPVWLNEGLAELYGSLQFSGNEALLGAPIYPYIHLLRDHELLPLETLFSIGTSSPHYNEQDKSGIFYGQSWALVHYLMLGERGRQEQFKRFLQQVSRGENSAKAIEDSFGVTIARLEEDLRAYVRRGDFTAQRIASVDDPQAYASYTAMQRTSLTEGEANFYLGDLLLHIGRDSDAERYYKQAITLDPNFIPAYAALGRFYVYQRRYAEAKKYLQKATTSPQSYMIHYLYAYVLSREGVSASGEVVEYSRETTTAMREQLLQSIKLAPNHAPSHYLLALVDFIADEHLDEAIEMAQKAQQLAPGNKSYSDLTERIKLVRSGAAHQTREPVKDVAVAEPAKPNSSSMFGVESGGVVINDGQTVDKSGSLPTVDELLAKYLEAMGGASALKAVTTRTIKGTVDVVGKMRGGKFETYAEAPNKIATIIDTQPMGKSKVCFNGRSGWTLASTGVRVLKGLELSSLQRQANFYSAITMKNDYAKITLAGKSKIGYREVFVLDLQPASGSVDRVYFDAQTYLPVRVNTVAMLGAIAAPVEIYLDDWRGVEGIKYPFSLTQSFGKLTLVFTVNEIKHNVPIDASMFEP